MFEGIDALSDLRMAGVSRIAMTIEFAAHIWFSANDNNDQPRTGTVHIAGRTPKAPLRLEVRRLIADSR